MSKFVKLPTGDKTLDRMQDGIASAFQGLANVSIMNGRMLADVTLTTTGQDLQHGLGRPYSGYLIVRADGPVSVHDEGSADDSLFLHLVASAQATVSIWVF